MSSTAESSYDEELARQMDLKRVRREKFENSLVERGFMAPVDHAAAWSTLKQEFPESDPPLNKLFPAFGVLLLSQISTTFYERVWNDEAWFSRQFREGRNAKETAIVNQFTFFAEELGGPELFNEWRNPGGQVLVAFTHQMFRMTPISMRRWMEHMTAAVDKSGFKAVCPDAARIFLDFCYEFGNRMVGEAIRDQNVYAQEIAALAAEHASPQITEPFQKWINYKSQHQSDGDVLNRARIYFCRVDRQGRVVRCSHLQRTVDEHMGVIKDAAFLDVFWQGLRRNEGAMFTDWPFVSRRGYERHFLQPSHSTCAPVVIQDIVTPEEWRGSVRSVEELSGWRLRYSPTNTLPFDITRLRVDPASDCLVYPFEASGVWCSFKNEVAGQLVDLLQALEIEVQPSC